MRRRRWRYRKKIIDSKSPLSLHLQEFTRYKYNPDKKINCVHGISDLDRINQNTVFQAQKGFRIWSGIVRRFVFSKHHLSISRCIQTNDPLKGISRYNESHFHYDGYTFELAEEFSFLNLSNSNTFPING